eukprot:SAG31_NODE_21830_length_539_cov_14.565909_1_plen_100_part_10
MGFCFTARGRLDPEIPHIQYIAENYLVLRTMPAHRVTGSRAHASAAGRAEPAPTGAAPQISRPTRQNSSLATVGWQALLEQADREGVPQQPSPAAGQALN